VAVLPEEEDVEVPATEQSDDEEGESSEEN